jgi:hypothetical protein
MAIYHHHECWFRGAIVNVQLKTFTHCRNRTQSLHTQLVQRNTREHINAIPHSGTIASHATNTHQKSKTLTPCNILVLSQNKRGLGFFFPGSV